MSLRFGLLWPFRNPAFARVPWEQFYRSHLDLIVQSEAMGFDSAWLSEHHFVDDGYSPSVHTIGGAVAARTTRIRIGSFLVLLPLHNPVQVAEDTATLDLISEGRFDLGVGLGYRRAEFENQGVSATTRGGRMEENLEIVRRLLQGETVSFDGKYTTLRDVRIMPPALQRPHPPMWAGGIAPKAIERVARLGFHYLSGGPTQLVETYDEALLAHGRDPRQYRVAGQKVVYVAKTRAQAWEIAARPMHHTATAYLDWYLEANDTPDYKAATQMKVPSVEEIIRSETMDFFGEEVIVGTPKDVIEKVEDYRSRGRMTDLVCMLPLSGMAPHHIRDGMELFAREVIPHFRTDTAV